MQNGRLPRRHNTRLLAELRRQGLSIQRFAEQMSTTASSVWRIEAGHYRAPLDWYERAARVLGVPVEDLVPTTEVAA